MIVRAMNMEYIPGNIKHTLVFAPKEHSILAMPGRAWYRNDKNKALKERSKFERSFRAWNEYAAHLALPGQAKIECSVGARI